MSDFKYTKEEKIKIGIFIFVVIMVINFVDVKIGLQKYSSTLNPSSWDEYFSQAPKFSVIAAFISYLIVHFEFFFFKKSETYICIKCLEPISLRNNKNLICTKCSGTLEPLKGFYDHHPDLKHRD